MIPANYFACPKGLVVAILVTVRQCSDYTSGITLLLQLTRHYALQSVLPNYPHKLTNRRSVGSAAEPPRAARTARRHGGCTSLPPNVSSVAAPALPHRGRHVRRLAA